MTLGDINLTIDPEKVIKYSGFNYDDGYFRDVCELFEKYFVKKIFREKMNVIEFLHGMNLLMFKKFIYYKWMQLKKWNKDLIHRLLQRNRDWKIQ